jgi:hypothetical protein
VRASSSLRSLRAALFAAACVVLAAAAHTLSMGVTPGFRAMAAGFSIVAVPAFLAGSREQSLRGICAAMGLVQVGLHLLFDAATGTAASSSMAGMTGMTSMTGMPGMDGSGAMVMARHHAMSGQAVAAHALAALLAAWWLRRGEAALWTLLRHAAALAPALVRWLRTRTGPPVAPAAAVGGHGWRPAPALRPRLLLRHAVNRRGPPVPSLTAHLV